MSTPKNPSTGTLILSRIHLKNFEIYFEIFKKIWKNRADLGRPWAGPGRRRAGPGREKFWPGRAAFFRPVQHPGVDFFG